MAGLLGLKTSYALLIIVLMVLGIVAGAFYFYNAASQNPCGDPGKAQFTPLPNRFVNGRNYTAVAARFTGTGQDDIISIATFLTTVFNDPQQPHLLNGSCVSDPSTPVTVRFQVKLTSGLQESLPQDGEPAFAYGGYLTSSGSTFTSGGQAGLQWNVGDTFLTLLVAA